MSDTRQQAERTAHGRGRAEMGDADWDGVYRQMLAEQQAAPPVAQESEYEAIARRFCHEAGCRCPRPLLGWTEHRTPRCRLCSTDVRAALGEARSVEPPPQEPSDRIVLRLTTAEGSFHQHADDMAGRRDGACPTCGGTERV